MKNGIEQNNRFYIEMFRKVLSEKEYDVLQKLLIEKMTLQEVATIYGITGENIHQIYERTYKKVMRVTLFLDEMDNYKLKLEQLKYETEQIKKRKNKTEIDLQKMIYESHFPFSKRMRNMFEFLDIHTIGQLAEIPLKSLGCFRGFKKQCKKELISFIEFENIEHLFKDFSVWKALPIQ